MFLLHFWPSCHGTISIEHFPEDSTLFCLMNIVQSLTWGMLQSAARIHAPSEMTFIMRWWLRREIGLKIAIHRSNDIVTMMKVEAYKENLQSTQKTCWDYIYDRLGWDSDGNKISFGNYICMYLTKRHIKSPANLQRSNNNSLPKSNDPKRVVRVRKLET